MSDTQEIEPVPETTTEPEEPLLKPTKKEKKARTQAQLDAFEKARLKRLENIKAKNMAKKEKELEQYKAELPKVEEAEEEYTPNNPEPPIPEEKINKVKKEKKPRKKPKTPPPSSDDDSSSSEEEYIIRRKKPTRNKRKTKAEQEELAQAVEAEQDRYYQNIIFV